MVDPVYKMPSLSDGKQWRVIIGLSSQGSSDHRPMIIITCFVKLSSKIEHTVIVIGSIILYCQYCAYYLQTIIY